MIGGRDIILRTTRGVEALDLALRAVIRLWSPNLVLEDAETGQDLTDFRIANIATRREVLAFRDKKSAALWDELGADPSLDGTLIHFIVSKDALTLAVDAEPPPQINAFVASLWKSLVENFLLSISTREAA